MPTPVTKKTAHRLAIPSLHSLRYRLRLWLAPQTAKPTRRRPAPPDEEFRQLSFTFAVIALSARVACADGALSREKYIAFREAFPLKGQLCSKIRSLFTLACENPTPPDYYTSQIKALFPNRHALYVSLVERLSAIAAADGAISREAERLLGDVAQALELSPTEYAHIVAVHSPHKVLGVERKVKKKTLKRRYRELMRRYHPDRFVAQGISPDIALLLQLKSSEINEAYRKLCKITPSS